MHPPAAGFRSRYHAILVILYAVWWVVLAVDPVYREDWVLENLLVVVTVVVMWRLYHRLPLSDVSYTLIAIFLAFHTLGSHYTYAEVPLGDWMAATFEFERNHYDRVIHFAFGLLMYWPFREVTERAVQVHGAWIDYTTVLFVVALSAFYEAIEWVAATIIHPEAAYAFLGTQGDLFDAQKDHALAIVGAIISFFLAKWLIRSGRLPVPN